MTDRRRLHDHLLLLHDFDYELYEEAINDWDHAQRVMKQDYDLDMIEGWSGGYGEITYINIDGNCNAPRHDEGPDGGGAASTV
ncbi:hypothetical protein N9L31_00135 [bacterium]|nr:hypothetical protein [bacterium]